MEDAGASSGTTSISKRERQNVMLRSKYRCLTKDDQVVKMFEARHDTCWHSWVTEATHQNAFNTHRQPEPPPQLGVSFLKLYPISTATMLQC
jgi:hypothetical protein